MFVYGQHQKIPFRKQCYHVVMPQGLLSHGSSDKVVKRLVKKHQKRELTNERTWVAVVLSSWGGVSLATRLD